MYFIHSLSLYSLSLSLSLSIYIYIYISETLVKGDPMAPFSIATARRGREERYSIPWIAPLYLDPYFI